MQTIIHATPEDENHSPMPAGGGIAWALLVTSAGWLALYLLV
jgi:hypothetical protein